MIYRSSCQGLGVRESHTNLLEMIIKLTHKKMIYRASCQGMAVSEEGSILIVCDRPSVRHNAGRERETHLQTKVMV